MQHTDETQFADSLKYITARISELEGQLAEYDANEHWFKDIRTELTWDQKLKQMFAIIKAPSSHYKVQNIEWKGPGSEAIIKDHLIPAMRTELFNLKVALRDKVKELGP